MSAYTLRLRVNRVEYWRPEYADTGPILTQVEVRCDSQSDGGPVLRFEHQADGQYVPTRLVLNFNGRVTDYEPGDYLDVTIAKAPAPAPLAPDEIPF